MTVFPRTGAPIADSITDAIEGTIPTGPLGVLVRATCRGAIGALVTAVAVWAWCREALR